MVSRVIEENWDLGSRVPERGMLLCENKLKVLDLFAYLIMVILSVSGRDNKI